ncbi:uncharacterized protein GVI51_L00143 [Nakaseomyces glabratus]|uniref:ERCC1-like central domain-containing protein n=1 Tax=Candida glabrata (strain ATCC 2001 / BCRC 20586 / JCM 3761 / NBRC 0622 / NRRL Y-65 / CBS 138) TaxID=284593 RepID=Q6FLV5_CANGA|nr:uncharacterized protein CAGL0L00363g [Nakaseomyces glabratus]KAH7595267.1 Binding domain of DNA repair protein Ercc1 (rad10/Swi10) [Nakaseomyces glabratus]KAH7601699.1 Binding domain of DNA repair protein Ercc1 (rad10/Swi10) [Nakaseomyces glabratus]QHS68456.1 uncharacterized protein GVI51_L00143 [Nakaseomyces glabratus]CAG61759.1 unnamed protein product [Nakaseomyces glabratus]|eukprot:XP_448789.1 uncharacterized protein CAGL0L00363g [[Candida] glabrata]
MNNTDSTSFQSILAGVERLRKQKEGAADKDRNNDLVTKDKDTNFSERKQTAHVQDANKVPPRNKNVINAFNQQRYDDDSTKPEENGKKRPFITTQSGSTNVGKTVLVSTTQKENPLLNHLKNTNWRYSKPQPGQKIYYDYKVKNRSILFLTLSYHKLYVDYIERRMLPLKQNNDNILIFVVDDTNSEEILTTITKICLFNGFTLLLAFNFQQAAKYLEGLNSF